MTPYHATPDATFFVGDCRAVLGGLDAGSVHAAITSPPYFGLRRYEGVEPSVWGATDPTCEHEWGDVERAPWANEVAGPSGNVGKNGASRGRPKESGQFCRRCGCWYGCLGLEPDPDLFCAHLVEVFRAVKRVLRRDGLLFVNLGSSYSSNSARRKDGMRSVIRDFGGDGDLPKWSDYADQGQVKRAADFERMGIPSKCDLCIPDRFRLAMVADGWIVRVRSVPWIKRSCMPGSQQDRPTVATEDWIMLAKSGRYYWDQEAVRREQSEWIASGSLTKFGRDEKYVAANAHRGDRLPEMNPNGRALRTTDAYFDSLDSLIADTRRTLAHLERIRERGGLLLADDGLPLALDVTSQGSDLAHYASFPEGVVTPWILGGSPQEVCAACGAGYERVTERTGYNGAGRADSTVYAGLAYDTPQSAPRGPKRNFGEPKSIDLGWAKSCHCPTDARQPAVVLDCFLGSGTTAVAARRLGRRVVGVDASQVYVDMAVRRLEGITPTLPTPSPRPPPATQLALGEGR